MLFAKRGKGKLKADFGLKDAYKIYKEDGGMLKYSVFSKILRDINTQIADKIIMEALEFNMPSMIGTIRIRKFKNKAVNADGTSRFKKLRPDWAKTKELWAKTYPGKTMEELKEIENKPLVRHLNEHTNGYSYEFYYNKSSGKYRNKSAYSFLPSRGIKNMLSAAALDDGTKIDYYE
jgi:hypothetical protein